MNSTKPKTIDEYISRYPEPVQKKLWQMMEIVKKLAPEAEEVISYGMPMFRHNGRLLYFAGYARHIGLYPMASGIRPFTSELKGYKWAKGSVQFPLDKPLPVRLITRIVKFRIKENLLKSKLKKKSAPKRKVEKKSNR